MKQGEIDYMKTIGQEAALGAYDKPFSHFTCSKNLVDMGLIMSLLPPNATSLVGVDVERLRPVRTVRFRRPIVMLLRRFREPALNKLVV